MPSKDQNGYVELFVGLLVFGLILFVLFVRFNGVNERVSGVVYNTTNNSFIGGVTRFSVRASEDTYVSTENKSSYCLPPNSPYIALVNKAAEDKHIKVVVTTEKYFAIQAPWVCNPNVKVTEAK